MNICSNDILIRRQDNELPTVWISEKLLLQLLPDIKADYLRKKARPAYKADVLPCHKNKSFLPITGKAWRWGKQDKEYYYDVDYIPNKAPTFYASHLPSRKELIALKEQAEKTAITNPIEDFLKPYLNNFQTYLTHYAYCKTKQQQKNLAQTAAFIEGCIQYISETGNNCPGTYKELAHIASNYQLRYIPYEYRNFRSVCDECIEKLNANGLISDIIQLPRKGNQHALVHYNDEQVASWILNMRHVGENFTNAYIIRKVQWLCTVFEKPIPSDRWIGSQMETANMKFLTAAGRYGIKGKLAARYRAYTPFAHTEYAGDCWQVDGSRVNMMDFKQKVTIIDETTGKEKKMDKACFLTVVAVRDAYSGDVVGHAFNLSENSWTYMQALKMAVETAEYLPYEIVFDRFPGHNTPHFESFMDYLKNLGVKVTITHKAEGKQQLERWFGTLQTVFMQESKYYYGEGIRSVRKFAHRSQEFLAHQRKVATKQGWSYDAAVEEATNILTAYRNTKYSLYSTKFKRWDKTPAEMHNEAEKPNVVQITPSQFTYLFGIKKPSKMHNMGLIDIEVGKAIFNYRVADYHVVSNYDNTQLIVSFLLDDMSKIEVYENSNTPVRKHLCTAQLIENVQKHGKNAFKNYGREKAIIRELHDFQNQELEFKLAVGYESLTILEQGGKNKGQYQAAEDQATITLITPASDNAGANIRNQYS